MSKIARLAIQSGLPQLDRLFDYVVPDALLDNISIGSRVKVGFGNSKKSLEAFVIEFAESSNFKGQLSEVQSIVGTGAFLESEIFLLCRQLAERSACALGEVLKTAIPAHMPRAYAAHTAFSEVTEAIQGEMASTFEAEYLSELAAAGARAFLLSEPRELKLALGQKQISTPAWLALFLAIAVKNIQRGQSTIILVPDYREHTIVVSAIKALGLDSYLADYSQEQAKSKQYTGFLRALDRQPRIVVGSRSAAFAPVHKLGSILLYDESDRSYVDQSSPYLHTRDVALVRESIQDCSLVMASHSMSTDVRRLLDTGYLSDATLSYSPPRISISEPGLRVDSHAYNAIRQGLIVGSVLVQVASLGDSTALYCKMCDEVARCPNCSGPLWVDSGGSKKCRWCNGFALDYLCNCGSAEFSLGRAGATRTAAELGKSFPSARVVESTGENRLVRIKPGKTLVVATAGAEPYLAGGYAAVVLLDARIFLGKQNLRSLEESVRVWSNAVAKLATKSNGVLVGVSGELAQLFALWDHSRISSNELAARKELQLPPAVRMGSVTAELNLVSAISESLSQFGSVVKIGPAPVPGKPGSSLWRLIFKYQYSEGISLARHLKSEVTRIASGRSRVTDSGRNARAVTIKMNDAEVV